MAYTLPMLRASLATLALLVAQASAQQTPTPAAQAWWDLTAALSNDSMQGRDTGTPAYQRAADLVAAHFKADGIQPAGDSGTYLQQVAMHQTDLDMSRSSLQVVYGDARLPATSLKLLEEVTLTPRQRFGMNGGTQIAFLGYGLPLPAPGDPLGGAKDLLAHSAIVFNNTPAGLTPREAADFISRRNQALAATDLAAVFLIDNPAATEPFHWPAAYARSVVLQQPGADPPASHGPVFLRISPEAAAKLFAADPEHPFARILADGEKGLPLPIFPMQAALKIALETTEKDIVSPNILAILPGSDPSLKAEYVALSAHLDGYGFGTPVDGDNLYNGALDDAAYVATLLELAHNAARNPPKRSLLFCIFTGEEKGLLGSEYFTHHPTVPAAQIVADLNLDQLRPIFPLKILTMEGIADSTLGETARAVATHYNLELRSDREPERNLFRRADNYNFVRIGVPIASFIFGYNPGTAEERAYRNWYATRYHKPQDDLTTPIDWTAAVDFNRFYRALAFAVADAPTRPKWLAASGYAPKPAP